RCRSESRIGLPRLDRHAQVLAIPGGQGLGIAGLEEDTADSEYVFHANLLLVLRRTSQLSGRSHQGLEPTRAAVMAAVRCSAGFGQRSVPPSSLRYAQAMARIPCEKALRHWPSARRAKARTRGQEMRYRLPFTNCEVFRAGHAVRQGAAGPTLAQ